MHALRSIKINMIEMHINSLFCLHRVMKSILQRTFTTWYTLSATETFRLTNSGGCVRFLTDLP